VRHIVPYIPLDYNKIMWLELLLVEIKTDLLLYQPMVSHAFICIVFSLVDDAAIYDLLKVLDLSLQDPICLV
jgi:hypothetical protein